MRILDRYIARELIGPFLFGVAAFTLIFISGQYLFKLTAMVARGASLVDVTELLALRMVPLAIVTFPMATLLATRPSFILLDEPFTGIDPIEVHTIQQLVAQLKSRGIGVLITDHSVRETLATTDRAYIVKDGKIMTAGTSEEIANDTLARQYYLGDHFVM